MRSGSDKVVGRGSAMVEVGKDGQRNRGLTADVPLTRMKTKLLGYRRLGLDLHRQAEKSEENGAEDQRDQGTGGTGFPASRRRG